MPFNIGHYVEVRIPLLYVHTHYNRITIIAMANTIQSTINNKAIKVRSYICVQYQTMFLLLIDRTDYIHFGHSRKQLVVFSQSEAQYSQFDFFRK